jgi:hypothetical protein
VRPALGHAHSGSDVADIRAVQELPGHANVAATLFYMHVLKLGGGAVRNPVDTMSLTYFPQVGASK